MTSDPFLTLGVGEDAGDDEIKRHYLALVRRYSPERDPIRFQQIRAAFEVIGDVRGRLRHRLLQAGNGGALQRLMCSCLEACGPTAPERVSREIVSAVLLEGVAEAVRHPPTAVVEHPPAAVGPNEEAG